MKTFIVIEFFDMSYPVIVTDEDGMPKIFDNLEEATKEANECQYGKVIEL